VGENGAWPSRELFDVASAVGRQLPPAQAERLGRALWQLSSPEQADQLAYLIPAPSFSTHVERLVHAWRTCPDVSGATVATAVAAASHAHAGARQSNRLELVLSGPTTESIHARRTEQVLLQLIAGARSEIILVTFALEMHDELRDALNAARSREVRITVLAEDPADNPGFRGDPARAVLGVELERLRWPADERPDRGAALHAKVVLVDRGTTLITSANLTRRASGDNLEAGVLIQGGDTATRIADHIEELLRGGTLTRA
jgi:phosphatidylserine/phosphatidylglycerophosphate/cardiolipin synthase-like enzyme